MSTSDYIKKLEKENRDLKSSRDFYKSRCELLQRVQKYMKDPERQIVCDILANNTLLPDPNGRRYGQDLRPLVVLNFSTQNSLTECDRQVDYGTLPHENYINQGPDWV